MNDTIAAISTAMANSALAIVRISGPDAIPVVSQIFKGKNLADVKSQTVVYGHIVEDSKPIDEVMVAVHRKPHTFTAEDLVEITCHGGVFVTQKVLSMLLLHGARMAEPGEFTKRAFLNGRIDLTQAEAVMDLIEAQTESALKMANQALLGKIKMMINELRNQLLTSILEIEVNIDYPEYLDEKQITTEVLLPNLVQLKTSIDEIVRKSEVGTMIQHGIRTAIIGKPNVGKSSLLNALLKEERAIVTSIAGTTRDTIEASYRVGGVLLKLIDTAGIHEAVDVVEKIGIERTKRVIQEADLVLLVFDNSTPLDDNDRMILKLTEGKRRLIIINKQDLISKINLTELHHDIMLSSYHEQSIDRLEQLIRKTCLQDIPYEVDDQMIGSFRQQAKIRSAQAHLSEAIKALEQGMPVDIVNIDLRAAYDDLSHIVGESTSENLQEELFKRFCLGK